jgi:hemerythrin-like domain-containing protein
MAYRHDILEELQSLRQHARQLMSAGSEELRQATHQSVKTLVSDAKTFVNDLRDALALEESEIERAFTGRAATALTTALVLGVAVGWMLRKKS